ncbi:MAG TPA: 2-hydroxyacid dehydrogenase [Geminicoccaceae bacterium]|nr:2-hydroxyacid dehydrogenase [Geminicoccaceae bacterium]
MQRVLFHYQASRDLQQRLRSLAVEGLDVVAVAPEDRDGLMAEAPTVDVLWHVLEPVTAALIERAPRLALIQKIGVGVNTIDLDAARARGIAVCNMPGTNSRAVAEMTLALMLAALRRLPQLDRATRAGRGWALPADDQARYGEIGGRTVGLVGYGAVPALLAPVLAAMGARVLFASRSERPEAVGRRVPLTELLVESDIVSLHLPLAPETEGLIGAAELAAMRPGALLVNTARGGLVDEAALVAALRNGRLGGAALDVFAHEPLPADHPLLALDNVVLAPHLAWLTAETLERSLAVAIDNCRRLRQGEPLRHRVV